MSIDVICRWLRRLWQRFSCHWWLWY